MDLKEKCYEKAIEVLEKCSTPNGFYAAYPGYDMVFARDSMIMSLGASLVVKKLHVPVFPEISYHRVQGSDNYFFRTTKDVIFLTFAAYFSEHFCRLHDSGFSAGNYDVNRCDYEVSSIS